MNRFMVYFDLFDPLMELDDAALGRMLRGVYDYARSGKVPDLTGQELDIFDMLRANIDEQRKRWSK